MLQPRTNEQVDKKAQFTMIHQMNEHKNNDVCLLESIKNQIWTSKISVVFIVLADQLRNSRHWKGYKRKMNLEKRHWIGLDLIQLDLIPPLREKSFFYQYFRYY